MSTPVTALKRTYIGILQRAIYPQTVKTHVILLLWSVMRRRGKIWEVGLLGRVLHRIMRGRLRHLPGRSIFTPLLGGCSVQIHTHVASDCQVLYAFVKVEEVYCFNICLAVDKNLTAVFHP